MGHQQITKAEAARHAQIMHQARETYQTAYDESLRQYQRDGDHAAFTARNQAASAARQAAVAEVWRRRGEIIDGIDTDDGWKS